LLIEALAAGSSRGENGLALVTLARVNTRLGDFGTARNNLMQANLEIEKSGMVWLSPAVRLASGELAYEEGRLKDARSDFDQASNFWVDELPETASVEGRALSGLMKALDGNTTGGLTLAQASLNQAQKMGAYWLEGRCLFVLGRIALLDRRVPDAIEILDRPAPDGDKTLGPELQAQLSYWRGKAREQAGSGENRWSADARHLLETLKTGLPEQFRNGFSSRPDIATILRLAVPIDVK
jgi:hypothetical protein